MKHRLIAFIVWCALLSAPAAQDAQGQQHILDLTEVSVNPTAPPISGGHARGFSGQQTAVVSVEVQLQLLDRQSYAFGNPITYVVSIKNIGRVALALPWSVDRARLERVGEAFTQASVGLIVVGKSGKEHRLSGVVLDGSRSVPGSIEILGPGEVAVIKSPGTLELSPEAAADVAGESPIHVRAIFTLKTDPSVTWERVLSTNSIPAVFRLRTRG